MKKKIYRNVCVYVRSRLEQVKPEPTVGLFNYRCHENAVEYARLHKNVIVVETIYIDGNQPILHFINYDLKSKKYLETTLGWRANQLEYYKTRVIEPSKHHNIHFEYEISLESWLKEFTNWIQRLVFRIDRVV